MRRTIQKELEDPLSRLILEGDYPYGTVFVAEGREGKLRFRPRTGPATLAGEEGIEQADPLVVLNNVSP
jgi:ATP-dependent Clp protease ATP-binding subunit ClpC